MKIKNFIPILILVAIALTGCGGDNQPPADIDALYTAAAETLGAQFTQQALSQPSETPTFTIALPPTAELPSPTNTIATTPTNTPPQGGAPPAAPSLSPCDVADFVADVTIPDGTEMAPGTIFTKTWEVKNIGTCTWNSNYKLIFYFGEPMVTERSFQLTKEDVANGKNLKISITMTAPTAAGEYYSHWRMQNDKGEVFGIGAGADSVYAQIKVVAGAKTQTPTTQNTATATTVAAPTNTPTETLTTEPPPTEPPP